MSLLLQIFVIFLISFIACSTFFYVLIPFLGFTFAGLINIIFYLIIVSLASISYYKACFTPPGYVPLDWKPDDNLQNETLDHFASDSKKKMKKQPLRDFVQNVIIINHNERIIVRNAKSVF